MFLMGWKHLASLWVLFALLPGAARAADLTYRPAGGGLQITLTTNANRFEVDPRYPLLIPTPRERRLAAAKPSVLVASVMLANRGADGVSFTFADAASAERKFRFKVFAENGTQVWESETDAAGETAGVEAMLERRSPWRRTLHVPMTYEGAWLASGRYTLEASLEAEGGPGATAVFDVVNLGGGSVQVPPNTGINGRVVDRPWLFNTEPMLSANLSMPWPEDLVVPVQGAYVTVREILPPNAQTIRAPFSWSGYTDANGSFRAPTIAGRFKVTASRMKISPIVLHSDTSSSGFVKQGAGDSSVVVIGPPSFNLFTSKEVEVPLGQFVSTTLDLNHTIIAGAKVHSVQEVSVQHIPTLVAPSLLRITAKGTVTSGGWSNARLVRRNMAVLNAESSMDVITVPLYSPDVVEFDLVATPPRGPATTVMSPVTASIDIPIYDRLREVRVYSQTDSQTAIVP